MTYMIVICLVLVTISTVMSLTALILWSMDRHVPVYGHVDIIIHAKHLATLTEDEHKKLFSPDRTVAVTDGTQNTFFKVDSARTLRRDTITRYRQKIKALKKDSPLQKIHHHQDSTVTNTQMLNLLPILCLTATDVALGNATTNEAYLDEHYHTGYKTEVINNTMEPLSRHFTFSVVNIPVNTVKLRVKCAKLNTLTQSPTSATTFQTYKSALHPAFVDNRTVVANPGSGSVDILLRLSDVSQVHLTLVYMNGVDCAVSWEDRPADVP